MSEKKHEQDLWPPLPLAEWQDTCTTLHMWSQIIGKIRLALAPMVNHWWQITFYITSRGWTTSPIPYKTSVFQFDFDFIDHELHIRTAAGETRSLKLKPRSVADFYRETMEALRILGIEVRIWPVPVEVSERIPFEKDAKHAAYDAEYARRHWELLVQADRVLKLFRSRYLGKTSPVHFFWGAFDLAVTRFSGRRAPDHPGVPNVSRSVMLEAYSHEVSSCGFWAGTGLGEPAFYAYAYPEPAGYKDIPVQPAEAFYQQDWGEFFLPYEAIRKADFPEEKILSFLQTTYEGAANLARWDRASLERAQ